MTAPMHPAEYSIGIEADYAARPFANPRAAALALLNSGGIFTRKAGSFLGQLVVDPTPLSDKQADWLNTLLARGGFPPLASEKFDD